MNALAIISVDKNLMHNTNYFVDKVVKRFTLLKYMRQRFISFLFFLCFDKGFNFYSLLFF